MCVLGFGGFYTSAERTMKLIWKELTLAPDKGAGKVRRGRSGQAQSPLGWLWAEWVESSHQLFSLIRAETVTRVGPKFPHSQEREQH